MKRFIEWFNPFLTSALIIWAIVCSLLVLKIFGCSPKHAVDMDELWNAQSRGERSLKYRE